ncbi:MAG: DUF2058 domain-containing protein [Gammaproteobacteria bacterium]|nr:DUF2058 domain-containing protein [Gammaproteobacteria bacterium]
MGNSLQDQLLQAGLVTKDQVNQAQKSKKRKPPQGKKAKQAARQRPVDPEVARQRAEKAARDRELNQQRDEVRRQREVAAQVRQLVREHRVERRPGDDDVAFNFQNKDKIKRLYVSPALHRQISARKLVIVNDNGSFELVPPPIADKIRARNPSLVIDLPDDDSPADDDPYAAYKVPDDLMW